MRWPERLASCPTAICWPMSGRNAGQHLLDHFKGRGQLRVEPRGVVRVTGRELELDEVSTSVQLRAHPHQRGRMPGRVYLGNDSDDAVLGVGCELAKVFGAVEVTSDLEPPPDRPTGRRQLWSSVRCKCSRSCSLLRATHHSRRPYRDRKNPGKIPGFYFSTAR